MAGTLTGAAGESCVGIGVGFVNGEVDRLGGARG